MVVGSYSFFICFHFLGTWWTPGLAHQPDRGYRQPVGSLIQLCAPCSVPDCRDDYHIIYRGPNFHTRIAPYPGAWEPGCHIPSWRLCCPQLPIHDCTHHCFDCRYLDAPDCYVESYLQNMQQKQSLQWDWRVFTVVNIKVSYSCVMMPCSLIESLPSFQELIACILMVPDAACYSNTSILFSLTTQYHIPQDSSLKNCSSHCSVFIPRSNSRFSY